MNAMELRTLKGNHVKCVKVQEFYIIIGIAMGAEKLFQRMIHPTKITKDLSVHVNTA